MKTNDSWTTDETYIKIKEKWKYLYRAVDSRGNTINFMLGTHTAWRTLKGFEVMNMIRKEQIEGLEKGDIKGQVQFIEDLFPITA